MRTEIPYNFMPAEQHFNSPKELLDAVGHYQQTRSFVDGDERFNAQEDKFEKLLKEDGGFVLMPIARDYAFLYRGQRLLRRGRISPISWKFWISFVMKKRSMPCAA